MNRLLWASALITTSATAATGKNWDAPEVAETVDSVCLQAPPLTDTDLDALEAFLRTLTDARYESLLPPTGMNQ